MRRSFATNEFYHLFNRGVDKRKIFLDKSDHLRFIHDLYEFNDVNPAIQFSRLFKKDDNVGYPISNIVSNIEDDNVGYPISNIEDQGDRREPLVNLHAFVLMSNHHHLLAEQLKEKGISLFVRKLHIGYTNAFNLKRKRSGHLFQGLFKDVHIENDIQLAHLVCYIHSNPLDLWKHGWKKRKLAVSEIKQALKFLENYRWSSHLDYLGIKNFPSLINKKFLLKFFGGSGGYRKFFIDWLKQYEKGVENIRDFILE